MNTKMGSEQNNQNISENLIQIGLFGYTGVGKTTYLATLYYLLASGKYNQNNLVPKDEQTRQYINERRRFIEERDWDKIPPNQGDPVDLYFDFTRKGEFHELFIKDYRGEDTSKIKESDLVDYFNSCHAIMILLSPKEISEKEIIFDRKEEINILLNSLATSNSRKKVKTPIVLVITQYDIILKSFPGITPEKFSYEVFKEPLSTLKTHTKNLNFFAISSKECVLKRKEPNFSELIHATDSYMNIAAPFFWAFDKIHSAQIFQERKPYYITSAVVGGVLLLTTSTLEVISFTKYKECQNFETISTEPKDIMDKYTDFKKSFWYSISFIVSKEELDNKIQLAHDKWELKRYNEIESKSGDYDETLLLIPRFQNDFPNSKYQQKIEELKKNAQLLKEDNELFKEIESNKSDFNRTIELTNQYISKFPNGVHLSVVENYRNLAYQAKSQDSINRIEERKRQEEIERNRQKEYTPSYSGGDSSGGSSGCCGAKAMYNKPYEYKKLAIMREFRDKSLSHYYLGLLFIGFYYKNSPSFVKILNRYPKLNFFIKNFIINPILWVLFKYYKK